MISRHYEAVAAMLKNTKPSPVHQIEAFEAWEAVVNGEKLFGKMGLRDRTAAKVRITIERLP